MGGLNIAHHAECLIYPCTSYFFERGHIGEVSLRPGNGTCTSLLTARKARSGSAHLEFLLEHKLIKLSPSRLIDSIYAVQSIGRSLHALSKEFENEITPPVEESKSQKPDDEPTMLLSPSDGRIIAETLEVPELEQEVERAIHQVSSQLRKNKDVYKEKPGHDSAAKKGER